MQPTKQDAINFLNQVIELVKDHNNYDLLAHWAELNTNSATNRIAEWYCKECNLSMEKFCAIQEVIAIPHSVVHIEYYYLYAQEMLEDVIDYDYGDELNNPLYSY